jgi:hypothetical protein
MQNARTVVSQNVLPRFQWEARQCVKVQAAPVRSMCEERRVKPKIQWGFQEVGDAKNIGHLIRKTTGNELSHPKRQAIWATNGKPFVVWLPKPMEAHIISPCALDARHRATGFKVCLLGFSLVLVSSFLLVPHSSFLE